MRYRSSMKKKLHRIALEWGRSHILLDALGIGKHGASLPERVQQLLRQLVGGAKIKSVEPPPDYTPLDADAPQAPPSPAKRGKKRK